MQSVKPNSADIGSNARKRIARRLLPFVFILYVVAYIDRVNASFAGLRMNAELHLSDGAFGLGVGIFYVSYILFEIPGALIVERWSARKWISRIMITWGIVTIATGFIHTGVQFYVARILLGFAEASFFPGMIVYLSRWFSVRDRSRALACLYAANPAASLVGAPVAGWLLGTDWPWLASWRWLFILEGIPAVVLGVLALFRLTDWHTDAHWLPEEERCWIANTIELEVQAKEEVKKYTIAEAFGDRRVLLLIPGYFLMLAGALGTIYWMPIFLRRLTGQPLGTVAALMLIPALIGMFAMLANGWHADHTNERYWHTAIPLLAAGLLFGMAVTARGDVPLTLIFLLVGSGVVYASYPPFWSVPSMILSGSAAAATFGLINAVGLLGGLAGPGVIGLLNDRTHSLSASFGFIAFLYSAAGVLFLSLRIKDRRLS